MTKLLTKKGDLENQLEKLQEKMAKSDYKEKVPVKVQEQDAEKVKKKKLACMMFQSETHTCPANNTFVSFLHSYDRARLNLRKSKKP